MRSNAIILLATLALSCAAAPGARGGGLPKGLGGDAEKEKKLTATCAEVVELVDAEKPDWKAVFEKVQSARKGLLEIVAAAKKTDNAAAPDVPEVPARTPLICYGKTTREDALRLLREQMVYYAGSCAGIIGGDRKYLLEWTGRSGFKKPERRLGSMTAALREAARTALMLSRPSEEVRVKKGEELFSDDFSKGAGEWSAYGQCRTRNEGDAFRLKDEKVPHPDAMMWTRKQFDGDFLAEFTFIPHTVGTRAGALFTICGTPKKGKTLAVCVGRTMNTYNYGINGYHFSMHRGNTGLGNVRRVGPGLKLLMSGKDPCPKPGQAYHVEIGKVGSTIFLVVDGKLFHQYFDSAVHGPVLEKGHIGLRHWAGLDASYKKFAVHRLSKN
jgi:hypothetical protein